NVLKVLQGAAEPRDGFGTACPANVLRIIAKALLHALELASPVAPVLLNRFIGWALYRPVFAETEEQRKIVEIGDRPAADAEILSSLGAEEGGIVAAGIDDVLSIQIVSPDDI